MDPLEQDYLPRSMDEIVSQKVASLDEEGKQLGNPSRGAWGRQVRAYEEKQPKPEDQEPDIREPRSGQPDKLTEISSKYRSRAD